VPAQRLRRHLPRGGEHRGAAHSRS
jgi:hypothetical protein